MKHRFGRRSTQEEALEKRGTGQTLQRAHRATILSPVRGAAPWAPLRRPLALSAPGWAGCCGRLAVGPPHMGSVVSGAEWSPSEGFASPIPPVGHR